MVGTSTEFLALQHKAARIARSDNNILLQGEPGTGKQRLAHVITPTTPFYDSGTLDVGGRLIKNWDDKGMGNITFTDVIKFSINTGMAHLGLTLGGEKENEYAKKFGFGTVTGSDVPGEEAGILYNPEDMVKSDVATMAIGQGIAVSPLQMLNAICAIANGGELLKPFIVKQVVAPSGEVIKEGHKEVVRRVITEEVAEQMRIMSEPCGNSIATVNSCKFSIFCIAT